MPNFEMISPYCGLSRYDRRFFVYYLETEDNVRREYVFKNDEDANNFYNAVKNLTAFMANVPARKRDMYHQEFSDLLLKEVDHKLTTRTTTPDEAAIAFEA